MEDDIVALLQDLGCDTAVNVISNFILRNPETENLIAAKMGTLLSTQDNPSSSGAPATDTALSDTQTQQPTATSFLSQAFNYDLASLISGSPHKMIFVVNMDLNMGRGKQCAQVAHAALGLYMKIKDSGIQSDLKKLNTWLSIGQKKIVVRGDNVDHLKTIKELAKSKSIPSYLVSDAGCTQIAPGSKTVLALFGADDELSDVTGSLRLL